MVLCFVYLSLCFDKDLATVELRMFTVSNMLSTISVLNRFRKIFVVAMFCYESV